MPIHMSARMSVCISIRMSARRSIRMSIHMPIHMSVRMSVHACLYTSIYTYLSPSRPLVFMRPNACPHAMPARMPRKISGTRLRTHVCTCTCRGMFMCMSVRMAAHTCRGAWPMPPSPPGPCDRLCDVNDKKNASQRCERKRVRTQISFLCGASELFESGRAGVLKSVMWTAQDLCQHSFSQCHNCLYSQSQISKLFTSASSSFLLLVGVSVH